MERYVIHVTKDCNCDCLYCYEDDKTSTYTWDEIKNLIDNIIQNRTSNTFGIEFLGGEPLLEWEYIRKSYEYMESIPEIDVTDYVITTNGTILTDEIADYISKNSKIGWAASMDGHIYANQLRVFKESRKNTYDKVLKNLKTLREEYNVIGSIHIVSHLYNVAMLSDSIDHLYKEGIRNIVVGTIEKTMIIDNEYCERFISELDIVSKKIIDGDYPGLSVAELEGLKPKEDIRSYVRDENGKVIAESYGRSGNDITHKDIYNVQRCTDMTGISEMIYNIRKEVYDNHQQRLKNKREQ